MKRRIYGELRDIVESRGGSMIYERGGFRHGAWVIRLGEKTAVIEASGNRSFPVLDRLYETTHPRPVRWDGYDGPLREDATQKLLALLR